MSMRVPPSSLPLERSMLAALVAGGDAWDLTRGMLTRDDFYAEAHAVIYDACVRAAGADRTPDVVGVTAALDAAGRPDLVSHVLDVCSETPLADQRALQIARDLRKLTRRRRVLLACISAGAAGYNAAIDTDEWLATTEAAVFAALQDDSVLSGPRRMDIGAHVKLLERRNAAYKDGRAHQVDFGIPQLDEWLKMSPGDLIVIGGRPGEGKTALAQQIADRACERGVPGLVFSMEMPEEQLVDRRFAAHAGVPLTDLRRGALSQWHWERLTAVAPTLDRWPLYVDDTPSITVAALASAVKLAVRRWGVKFVVVDYLQLMGTGKRERGDNREQAVAAMSKGLKACAMSCGVPVIVLSQFNRGPEQRADNRPKISDFRESGAIEQDADAAVLIWRQKDKTTLILDKNRFGPKGDVDTTFDGARTQFREMGAQEHEYNERERYGS